MTRLAAEGIALEFDPAIGLIARVEIEDEGRRIAPFHTAPWVGSDETPPDGTAPHLLKLGGDFFCAPFAASEDESGMHGWPANSQWLTRTDGATLTALLECEVFGARLTKELHLRDGHPLIYQRHIFDGGTGETSVANHANISVPGGALISTSRKLCWETPGDPQESDPAKGRSKLTYPARVTDPRAFPADGGDVDLTRYPWGAEHEDFVMALEAEAESLGWTAVVRKGLGDVYLSLRSPAELPMTMLWHSNGGRDYPPWSGRHFGCLGVEEGAAAHMLALSGEGDLCGPGTVRLADARKAGVDHVTGAIAWPVEEPVEDVEVDGATLVVRGASQKRRVPFDASFLAVTRS